MLTRRTLLGLGLSLTMPSLRAFAEPLPQPSIRGTLDLGHPVIWEHPLSKGLLAWWRNVDGQRAGSIWYDLCHRGRGVLTGMGTTPPRQTGASGWGKTGRSGHDGEMRFDGANDYIDFGLPPALNLTGSMSFFCALVVQGSASAVGDVLIAATDASATRAYTMTVWQDTSQALKVQWGGSTVAATPNIIVSGTQYYCGFARSGVTGAWTCQIYALEKFYTTASIATNPQATATKITLGGAPLVVGSEGYFQGNFDDVMVWRRPLTLGEFRMLEYESRRGWPTLLRRLPLPGLPEVFMTAKPRSTIF